MKYLYLPFIVIISMFFASCDLINRSEEIPSYIKITKFDLKTNYLENGANTQNITDAWLYVDEDLKGIFELPFTVPIIDKGEHRIKVRAGIKVNGIAASRDFYPCYTAFDTIVNLADNVSTVISPEITYEKEIVMDLIEDFEDPGLKFDTTASSTVDFIRNINSSNTYGLIHLDNENTQFECKSNNSYYVNTYQRVFIEIDYKTNNVFKIGIFAHKLDNIVRIPVININTKNEWSKIYINLTAAILENYDHSRFTFEVYINAVKDSKQDEANIYIDNIKLVHI